jgi:putative phosphoserine phosphatase/1-acylglycerol-3-phosphate O-acyltransferase
MDEVDEDVAGDNPRRRSTMELDALLAEIRTGPRGPRIGAFFDFDGTLIDGYSAGALYSHRLRNFEMGPAELIHTLRATGAGTLSEEQFGTLMSMGIAGWAGRPVEDLEELGERLFRQGIAGRLFHETWRLVKAHQRQGHTVVIATSATRLQVAPLARELGVEDVLCTELEAEQGLLTGKVSGRAPWGAGKIAAVRAFARRRKVSLPRSFAYANGDEDVPFLSAIGNPRAVNPQRELARTAAERGWPVLQSRRGPGRLDPQPALRTSAMYATLIGSGIAGVALGALSGNRRRGIDFATSLFAQIGGVIGDVDVRVVGERHVWAHRPAVYFINHQSSLIDLLVTSTLLRSGFTAVAKAQAAGIPVIGRLLTMADFAFIDRSDSGQARAALRQALERLEAGTSIVISPEGTRSLTPRVGRLKKGGFHLAMQAGVPIVPIVIRNAGELMWRNAKTARTGTVEVLVHEPIPTTGWTKQDLDRTVELVQKLYEDTLEEWPGPSVPAWTGATS